MKQRSSFLFATWSFLSLYAAAGLCTPVEPLPQHEAHSLVPAQPQPQPQQEHRVRASPDRPRQQAPARGEAPSLFGPENPSQLQHPDLQHPSQSQSPARRRFAASRRANTGVCTFTVSQVQQCTPDSPPDSTAALVSYLQINTIYAPDSTIAADLLHQRPLAEYNSYQRLLVDTSLDVANLKDDSRTLRIIEDDEGDLEFYYGSAKWTEDTRVEDEGAGWCEEAEWYEADDWSCPHGETTAQRVSLTVPNCLRTRR